jgi:NTP pyrophosphatase (non-canonical NTP hydrolase)
MKMSEYSQAARSTRLATADHSYVVLNLVGELGELYGKFAKAIRDGSKVEIADIKKELGDILWQLSALCDDLGTDLEEVAILNLQKLSKRKENNTLQGSGDNR